MSGCRLVAWHGLPVHEVRKIFPDVVHLGGMSVEFDTVGMAVYKFKDAAGNSAFAFDRGEGLASHGSQILSGDTISSLKQMGATIG